MHAKRRFFWPFILILLFLSAACTLLLDRSKEQCANDGECTSKFGAGAICRDSVCTKEDGGTAIDSGEDVATSDVNAADSGDGKAPDATFGQDGCVNIIPSATTTNEEFLNACTTAQCAPFDNCALLGGLCDGGMLGPVLPEAGSPAAPPGPDSGATELCTTLAANAGTLPVYVTGSSNFPPFIKAFAPVLFTSGYSVVWQTSNSCAGVDSVYNDYSGQSFPIADPAKTQIKERAGRITEFYDPTGLAVPCLLSGNVTVDVGESDIYAKTCEATIKYNPDSVSSSLVGEYLGPTMAMTFIVPGISTQTVTSAEAAQAIFGRGAVPDTTKLPFDDPNQFFNRASSTATNQIISKGIFIDPTKWWGVDKRTAGFMATQMKQVPGNLAQKTIGIISTDFADSERGNIKTLAFQARNQGCGFWPDSTPFSEDKQNVRDGHYPLWGPIHFFARLNGGVPSAAAGAFVLRFSVPKLDEALVKGIIDSHNVPECAMKVTRDTEMGPIKAFTPPYVCDCFFEKTATGTTSCHECKGPQDCTSQPGRPACNYGFCELK